MVDEDLINDEDLDREDVDVEESEDDYDDLADLDDVDFDSEMD